MYKKTDEIFVRIAKHGYIPYIGICGPIPNPIKVTTETCLKLVNAGIVVHQFDPVTKQTVQLTRSNVFDDRKFARKKTNVAPVNMPPVVTPEKPVEPVTFTGIPKAETVAPAVKVEETVIDEAKVETPVSEEKVEEPTENGKVENAVNKFNKKNKNQ